MSSTFSSSPYLSFTLSPPAVHHDDCLSGSTPFLVYPSSMAPYKGPLRGRGPALLPYLSSFQQHRPFSWYECSFEPAFIQKRNERERQRVRCVNQGYAKLRDHLPGQNHDKRLSKVETLRAAIRYIKYLQDLVDLEKDRANNSSTGPDRGCRSEGWCSGPDCGQGTEGVHVRS